jgi:hypothetical protein
MYDTHLIPETSFQWAWDQTSLGYLKECPRKYYYKMIVGYRSREDEVHFTFGAYYHKALEAYDYRRSAGDSHETAMREATKVAMRISWGWNPEHPNKNRFTLIRSVVWYLDFFAEDPAETFQLANGKPAVELTFRMETPWATPVAGLNYIFTGHMDRIVLFAGGQYVLDRKTTKYALSEYYFEQFAPDNQFSMYSMAAKIVWNAPINGVLIDAAQIAVGYTTFKRGMAFRSDGYLDEWYEDTQFWIYQAQVFAEAKRWPQNDKSCHKYQGCEFRAICRLAPSARQPFLDTKFKVEPWNPIEPRGQVMDI